MQRLISQIRVFGVLVVVQSACTKTKQSSQEMLCTNQQLPSIRSARGASASLAFISHTAELRAG